ncbi:MAG: hypothetical protein QME12_05965 [Nanoarchaeota archaeon]|nr:hypothetical protein [Nanoarchaeota archaeon]
MEYKTMKAEDFGCWRELDFMPAELFGCWRETDYKPRINKD